MWFVFSITHPLPAKPQDEPMAEPAPLQVSAAELLAAYEANEQAAQLKYGQGPLEVSGTISSIQLDLFDDPMISLESGEILNQTTLHFSKRDANEIAGLAKGQQLTALCKRVSEVLAAPQASDCSIVSSDANAKRDTPSPTVLVPDSVGSDNPEVQSDSSTDANIYDRADKFVETYFNVSSQDASSSIPWLTNHYAPTVDYFGTWTPNPVIISQKRAFIQRWPQRSYRLRPTTVETHCDIETHVCKIDGSIDFSAISPERHASSSGQATFELSANFSMAEPIITGETSKVISRN